MRLIQKVKGQDWTNWAVFLSRHCRVGALDVLVDGFPALYWAWRADQMHVFVLLLQHGANPNVVDMQGTTVLQIIASQSEEMAMEHRNWRYMSLLLDYGAQTTSGNRGILARACSAGHVGMVRFLLAHRKVDVNEGITCVFDIMSNPVYEAAVKGHHSILRMLLQRHPWICGATKRELMMHYPDFASTRTSYTKCMLMLETYVMERTALARLAALGHVMIFQEDGEEGSRVADFASICPFVYRDWMLEKLDKKVK